MRAIKKVEVVPLDVNYGKIIDSFDTTDNKSNNAPSINAVETYVGENLTNYDTSTEVDTKIDTVANELSGEITSVGNSKQNTILSGTGAPSSSLGQNGDVYLQYS